MKKSFIIVLTAMAVTSFAGCSKKSNETDVKRIISVSGTGTVSIPNEKATISLSVVTRNKEALAASQENAKKMDAIEKALKDSLGLTGKDLATSDYSLYQESHWENGKQIYGDYAVSNNLRVFIKDVSKTGAIIDAATKAGANRFNSIQFSVEDTSDAEMKAREAAAKDAKAKAKILAESSGAKLGKLISISEGSNSYSRAMVTSNQLMYKGTAYNAMAEDEVFETTTEAGNSKVTVSIEAVYEIK